MLNFILSLTYFGNFNTFVPHIGYPSVFIPYVGFFGHPLSFLPYATNLITLLISYQIFIALWNIETGLNKLVLHLEIFVDTLYFIGHPTSFTPYIQFFHTIYIHIYIYTYIFEFERNLWKFCVTIDCCIYQAILKLFVHIRLTVVTCRGVFAPKNSERKRKSGGVK